VLPKAGSGRGGYYQDDGPGDNPPEGLEYTVDPIPVVEPLSRSGNRPYKVFGKNYVPIVDNTTPFVQRGTASWYGKKFHGQKTSSGELYDMYKITAAHPTLPIPSYARVTNLANGKQIIVRINDRGPFHSSRIMDLSYTAALKLGYLNTGSSEIQVERLLPADIEKMAENRNNQLPAVAVASVALNAPPANDKVAAKVAAQNPVSAPASTDQTAKMSIDDWLAAQASGTDGATTEQLSAPQSGSNASAGGYYIQFGAFAIRANAESVLNHIKELAHNRLPDFDIVQEGSLYRLISGPFASRDDAGTALLRVGKWGAAKPVIVQR
jgi:rare lipoprotein A